MNKKIDAIIIVALFVASSLFVMTSTNVVKAATTVSSFEWDSVQGGRPYQLRINNSEYYLIAAQGVDADGYLYTIKVWNNNGTIKQSVIDTYEFASGPGLDADTFSMTQIPDTNKYAILWSEEVSSKAKVSTVRVFDNGTIAKTVIGSWTSAYNMSGIGASGIVQLTGDTYALVHEVGGNESGYLETININTSGTINSTVLAKKNIAAKARFPSITRIDSGTVVIAYTGDLNHGEIKTYNISANGRSITASDSWDMGAMTLSTFYNSLTRINGTLFAYAFRNGSFGEVKTLRVGYRGSIGNINDDELFHGEKKILNTMRFDSDCRWPHFFEIKSIKNAQNGYFGVSYQQGDNYTGWTKTFTITGQGTIQSVVKTIKWEDGQVQWYPRTIQCKNNSWLIVYPGADSGTDGYDGWAVTINIPVPTANIIYPGNDTVGICRQPKVRLWVNSSGTIVTNFYSSGDAYTYTHRQKNTSINNTIIQWNYSQASSLGNAYFWRVTMYDGVSNISETFYFSTKSITPLGAINGKGSEFEWDSEKSETETGSKATACTRIGNSTYYLIAERAPSPAPLVVKTIQIDNETGTIGQSIIDTLTIDTSSSYYPSVVHVSGDVYAIAFEHSPSYVKTFKAYQSNGSLGNSVISSLSIPYAYNQKIVHVTGNWFCLSQVNATGRVKNNGTLFSIRIPPTGVMGTKANDSLPVFDRAVSYPKIITIDSDTVAVIYNTTGGYGTIRTFNFSSTGIIGGAANRFADTWNFSTSGSTKIPDIYHIAGTVYAVSFFQSGIKTVNIGANGKITKSWIGDSALDSVYLSEPYIERVTDGVYMVAYLSGSGSNDGLIKTINISNAGAVGSSTISTYCFAYGAAYWPVVTPIYQNKFLLTYIGLGSDGWATVVDITSSHMPTTYLIYPKNGSADINRQPKCRIWANDTAGGTLAVNFYSNSTGNWRCMQRNTSATANSIIQWNYSLATVQSYKYGWKVSINDSTTNISRVYGFTTHENMEKPEAVSSFEWDTAQGERPCQIRINDTEYYLIGARGKNDSDGHLYTIKVFNGNGTIYQHVVDTYEFAPGDGLDADMFSILHMPDTDKYVIFWSDTVASKAKVSMVRVFENGTIAKTVISTWTSTYGMTTGGDSGIVQTGGSIFTLVHGLSNNSEYAAYVETIWINKSGTINSSALATKLISSNARYPSITKIDDNTVAICYSNYSASNRGEIVTINLASNGRTLTRYDQWTLDLAKFGSTFYNSLTRINNSIFAYVWRNGSYGNIITTMINDSGQLGKNRLDRYRFDMECRYPDFFEIVSCKTILSGTSASRLGYYGISYQQGTNNTGWTKTLTITGQGDIQQVVKAINWEAGQVQWYPRTVRVSNDFWLIVYPGADTDGTADKYDGWAVTINISVPNAYLITPKNDSTGVCRRPNIQLWVNGSGTIVTNFYNSSNDRVYKRCQKNTTTGCAMIQWNYTQATSLGRAYFWRVTMDDGVSNISETYFFSTKSTTNQGSVTGKVSSFEWDPTLGQYPTAIRVGTSEYYLVAARGDGYPLKLYTMHIDNETGVIQQSLIDTSIGDTTNSYYPTLTHISGDIYAVTFDHDSDKSRVRTFKAYGSNGTINDNTIDYIDLPWGWAQKMVNVAGNIYCVSLVNISGTGERGTLYTIYIWPNGSIKNQKNDTVVFDSASASFPELITIDSNTVAVIYNSSNGAGVLKTYNISSVTGMIDDIAADSWTFIGGNNYKNPDIYPISGSIYAVSFFGDGNGGLRTVDISSAGKITKSWIGNSTLDDTYIRYPNINHVSGNVYAVAYQEGGYDGIIKTINITNAGAIGTSAISTYVFGYGACEDPIITPGSGNNFLITYVGMGNDGWAATVDINSETTSSVTLSGFQIIGYTQESGHKRHAIDNLNFSAIVTNATEVYINILTPKGTTINQSLLQNYSASTGSYWCNRNFSNGRNNQQIGFGWPAVENGNGTYEVYIFATNGVGSAKSSTGWFQEYPTDDVSMDALVNFLDLTSITGSNWGHTGIKRIDGYYQDATADGRINFNDLTFITGPYNWGWWNVP
jgi:hypothetical protein